MHKMNPLARGIHRNIDYRRMRSGEPASEDGDADVPQESPSQNRLRLGLIRRNSQAGAGGGGHHETSSHDSKGSGKVHTDRKVGVDDPDQVITATVVPAVNQQSSSSQVVRWDGEFPSGFSTSAAAAPDVILNEHNPPSQPNRHASMDSLLTSGTYEDVILNADHGTGNRRASMNSLITSGTANTHTQTRDTEVPLGPTITRPNNTVRHNSARSFRVPPTVCTTTSSFASLEQVEKPSITSPQMAWSRRVGVGHKMNSEKTINTVTTSGTTGTPNSGGNINNRSLPNNYPSNITISSPVSRSPSILQNQEVSPPSRQERMGFRQIVDEQERGRRRQEKHELTFEGLQRPSPPQRAASSSEDETEEDRMLRLTMEVSLREFEEKHRSAPALPPSRSEISANSSVSPSRSHNHSSSSPLLHRQNSTHSFTTSTTEEITEVLVEHPHRPTLQRRQSSNARIIIPRSATLQHSVSQQLEAARAHLSTEEAEEIERALREAGESLTPLSMSPAAKGKAVRATMSLFAEPSDQLAAAEHLSSSDAEAIERAIRDADEAAEVERAIREADELEQQRSINVALRLQAEEFARQNVGRQPQGNVRVMTHAEMMQSQFVGAQRSQSPPRVHSLELEEQRQGIGVHRSNSPMRVHPLELEEQQRRAFQMNPNPNFDGESDWNRRDRSTVVGPNNEIRTKHDLELKGQLNAERLGLEVDEDFALVGNTAFNSFKQSMSRGTKKGVATQGTGRATTDTDQTKAGAMDSKVRLAITRALNNGLIDKCNGVVKEGKEAVVYHADRGPESSRFDVAVKVFKRIQEFRGRGDYVDGDPRYNGRFRDASAHEQLNIWAEKEFRNLIRANRARVPVPSPLQQKDNIVFMRFMGENGWPAPQLRDLEVRRGSKTWTMLYSQIMVAIRRLYVGARLVHGDLSEYNVLVCPSDIVENKDNGAGATIGNEDELQAVLIDFGQAVEINHPMAMELLERDLEQIRTFFEKQGIKTLGPQMAAEFVTLPDPESSEALGLDSSSALTDESEDAYRLLSPVSPPGRSLATHMANVQRASNLGSSVVTGLSRDTRTSSVSTGLSKEASTVTGLSKESRKKSKREKKEKKHRKDKDGKTKKHREDREKNEEKEDEQPKSKLEQLLGDDREKQTPRPASDDSADAFFDGKKKFVDWDSEWDEEIEVTKPSAST